MKNLEVILLFLIIIVSFSVRLYKIDRPLADWHSWRQADTAAVSRNFIKEGFNPFIPKYDDMSSQANGLDNPKRYRFVEFPVYNLIVASVWKAVGVEVIYARLTTVLISIVSLVFLYFLVKYFSGVKTALLSAFFFGLIPYNVFYSSAILPGPLMVTGVLGLYISFLKLLDTGRIKWWIASVLFANLAILSWPIALFFFPPLVYLAWEKYKINMTWRLDLLAFGILAIVPFIAWRLWINNFPEGIPNWRFLLNEDNIRFKGAFFRWIFVERMGKLILTFGGLFLMLFGLLIKPASRKKYFYFIWLASCALYFVVFASGNVRHDYYQVPFVPIASVFMAKGLVFLFDLPSKFFIKYFGKIIGILAIVSVLVFGFYEIRGFYWINKPQIVEAGKAVDRLLPADAIVIAPYRGDAAFLYQTNRYGYPLVDRPLEKFIDQGTKYFVSVEVLDSGIMNLASNCRVIEKTPNYVILELFKECIGR